MNLTIDTLEAIIRDLKKLQDAGLNVTSMVVAGHTVLIRRSDSQLDGLTYHIIGITQDGVNPQHLVNMGTGKTLRS